MTAPMPPPDAAAPAPLVGRTRERALLRGGQAAARAGRGGIVLIGGEAGIGKTALAEWLLAEAAEQGALPLVGRCYDLAEAPPYGPWLDLLGRLRRAAPDTPELAALPTPFGDAVATSAHEVHRGVVDALLAHAARVPLALLLDDLHWADEASLALLRALGQAVAGAPLLVLGTYRPEDRSPGLGDLLPRLTREAGAGRLALARLTPADTAALVAARFPARLGSPPPDLAAALHARSDGNPFFLLEMLRDLDDDALVGDTGGTSDRLPETIREVLEARLRRLTPPTQGFLEVAALLGERADPALAGEVLGLSPDATGDCIEEALAAHLLREGPGDGRAGFAHPLIPAALRARQSAHRRRARHARLAAALRPRHAADPDRWTADLARHLRAAGRGAEAAPYFVAAAGSAAAVHAERAAADYSRAALDGLPPGDATGRAGLLLELGWVLRHVDGAGALAALDDALDAACQAGDVGLIGRAQSRLGLLRIFAGDFAGGLALTRRGAEGLALGTPEERREAAGNWHSLAMWYAVVGRYRDARAAVDRSVALHGALPPALVPPWATPPDRLANILNFARAMLGRPDEARATTARRRAVYYAARDLKMVAATIDEEIRYVLLPYDPGDREAVAALLDERARACAVTRAAIGTVEPPRAEVAVRLLQGRWDEAARLLDAREEWADPLLVHAQVRAVLRAELWLARGDRAGATAALRVPLPAGPATAPGDGDFPAQLAALRLGATLAREDGDLDRARAFLTAHDRWLAWSGATLGRAEGALGWAAHYRAACDAALAREHAARALAHASEPRQPLALLAAHRLLGELATTAGDHADAAQCFDAALALADACAAPYERALALLALADLRVTTGDRDGALAALAEARALLAPLDARPARARADALAERLAPPTDPSGLTAREAEVLRLVAQGLTNREVAARLAVSPRTVGAHLDAVYGKLGVATRTAAAHEAHRRGLA
jgi:DNA-binding CsgD family transcriptional regulator